MKPCYFLRNNLRILILTGLLAGFMLESAAQRVAPAQPQPIVITGAIIHVGNGQVLENASIRFENGKITQVGNSVPQDGGALLINATGKHIYPGLIAPNTQLGLSEIELVRATRDFAEVGIYNPGIRSLVAYNTDSRIIPTIRSNGILLAETVPVGGTLSGTSSVMQLDAWNWEDAAYLADGGLHLNWPSFFKFKFDDNGGSLSTNDDFDKQVYEIRQYFSQAKSYTESASHMEVNLNFEALREVMNRKRKIFIHCDYVREIISATLFANELNFDAVIVGGRDAYLCLDVLKQYNMPVILGDVHSLPAGDETDIEIPFATAARLQKAGILYALSMGGTWNTRNLPFTAGTTVAYGLSKEDALKSITSNTAQILGIADRTGTLESGKDANLVISDGDILDMRTSNVIRAFIQGRDISLDNVQKELYRIYSEKYGLR